MNVSIVIPTYNRKPILEKCLVALENQKLNKNTSNYEILVVDDGSTDGTSSWIKKNKAKFPHVVLLQQEHGGPALGRNLGVFKIFFGRLWTNSGRTPKRLWDRFGEGLGRIWGGFGEGFG